MQRTPEPELMTGAEQVDAYAQADFEEPNALFSTWVLDRVPDGQAACVDLGCGPGDIVRRLAAARRGWSFDGVDGSEPMIERARQATPAADAHRIRFHVLRIGAGGGPPPHAGGYDVGLSNSLLHHLHDPADLWTAMKDWLSPRAHLFVMDLLRPDTAEQAAATVSTYAADEPEVLRRDFHHSLLAAYRPEELAAQLDAAGLPHLRVEQVSDRHLMVWGPLSGSRGS
jgi:SAM-dependent methyltransferase